MAPDTGDPQLGRRIREARERAGMTQDDVVSQMRAMPEGRDRRWLSNIERGKTSMRLPEVAELSRVLGVTTDALLIGERGQPSTDEDLVLYALRHAEPAARRLLLASARAIAEESGGYRVDPSHGDGSGVA